MILLHLYLVGGGCPRLARVIVPSLSHFLRAQVRFFHHIPSAAHTVSFCQRIVRSSRRTRMTDCGDGSHRS